MAWRPWAVEVCLSGSERLGRVALAALAAGAAACSGRTVVAVDPYDLIGFWRLDDGVGSATARDSSGWGNDGTLVDLPPATVWSAGGPEGTALAVEGKGYVNVVPSPSIDSITNQITVAASMYLEGTISDYATAISRQIGTGLNQLYHLSIYNDMKPMFIVDAPDRYLQLKGPDTIPLDTWLHVAGTWDGTEARLYLNGAVVATGALVSSPLEAEQTPLVLGGNGNNAAITELFPGRLADVILYRRVLTAEEIAQLASGAFSQPSGASDGGGQ